MAKKNKHDDRQSARMPDGTTVEPTAMDLETADDQLANAITTGVASEGQRPDEFQTKRRGFTPDTWGAPGQKRPCVFWLRGRLDRADHEPAFFDNPNEAPDGTVFGRATYARLEFPRGSGKALVIPPGGLAIDDRAVMIQLILENPILRRASSLSAGVVLYDEDRLLHEGWFTHDDFAAMAAGRHPDEGRKDADGHEVIPDMPNRPAPDFGLMSEDQLIDAARKYGVGHLIDPRKGKAYMAAVLKKWWLSGDGIGATIKNKEA